MSHRCTGAAPGGGRRRPSLAARGGRGVEEEEACHRRTEGQAPPLGRVGRGGSERAKRRERRGGEKFAEGEAEAGVYICSTGFRLEAAEAGRIHSERQGAGQSRF